MFTISLVTIKQYAHMFNNGLIAINKFKHAIVILMYPYCRLIKSFRLLECTIYGVVTWCYNGIVIQPFETIHKSIQKMHTIYAVHVREVDVDYHI